MMISLYMVSVITVKLLYYMGLGGDCKGYLKMVDLEDGSGGIVVVEALSIG